MKTTLKQIQLLFLIAWTFLLFSCAGHSPFTQNQPAKSKPQAALVVISLDGFRFDYPDRFDLPHLKAMAREGVKAESLLPVYPSKTFPNHLSIVTGVYPEKHGIVDNNFYDPERDSRYKMADGGKDGSWITATPLWLLAEMHGVKAASFFWPESNARIQGRTPTYYFEYNKNTPYETRIDQIIQWLNYPDVSRPGFITSYFSLADTQGHDFGPDSPQLAEAARSLDGLIGKLRQRLQQEVDRPVNLVIVSDHGMEPVAADKAIHWPTLAQFEGYHVANGNTQLMLYRKGNQTQSELTTMAERLNAKSSNRFQCQPKSQLDARLHYHNNPRIGDIVCEANPPSVFIDDTLFKGAATHGFSPYKVPNMGAIFIAAGPGFLANKTLAPFENIHLYPALATLLGLPVPTDIDGDLKVLTPILNH